MDRLRIFIPCVSCCVRRVLQLPRTILVATFEQLCADVQARLLRRIQVDLKPDPVVVNGEVDGAAAPREVRRLAHDKNRQTLETAAISAALAASDALMKSMWQ